MMKKLILISLFFSASIFAGGFAPQSKIDGQSHNGLTVFTQQSACESHYSESCTELPDGYNHAYHVLGDEMAGDCGMIGNLLGAVGIVTDECIATGRKIVVVDEAKKAQWLIDEAAKQEHNAGIEAQLKRIQWGQRVIALMGYKNSLKTDLTEQQITEMTQTYAGIEALLRTGALETAKSAIQSITPDGEMVTDQDKQDLVSEIDKFQP